MFNKFLRYGIPAAAGAVGGWIARGFSDGRKMKRAATVAVEEAAAKRAA